MLQQWVASMILNYCRGFRGLYFSNRKQNKTAYRIWKCISESSIWQRCTHRIDMWEKIWRHASKWRLFERKQCAYFDFSKRSPLPIRNVVTELRMEKIQFQIKLSDVGYSSFTRLTVFYTAQKREGQSTSQEDFDRIQEAFSRSQQISTIRTSLQLGIP
jgi:hypothetical protein